MYHVIATANCALLCSKFSRDSFLSSLWSQCTFHLSSSLVLVLLLAPTRAWLNSSRGWAWERWVGWWVGEGKRGNRPTFTLWFSNQADEEGRGIFPQSVSQFRHQGTWNKQWWGMGDGAGDGFKESAPIRLFSPPTLAVLVQ